MNPVQATCPAALMCFREGSFTKKLRLPYLSVRAQACRSDLQGSAVGMKNLNAAVARRYRIPYK